MPISSSRMNRIQEQKSSKKLMASVVLAVGVFVVLLIWGIPLLINMSVFLSSFNQAKESPTPKTNNPIFAPVLEPTFEATNSMPIKIKGYANTEGSVELYLNGDLFDTVSASTDGSFTFADVILKDGPNKLWTKLNLKDQKSDNSSELVILYTKEKPELEITSPKDDETVTNETKDVVVAGQTEAGNTVTINDHYIVVDPEGKFSYTQPLIDGDNLIRIKAVNKAGNETVVEKKVKYSVPS